jgi:GT2 family glycosyltransferase
MKNKVFICITVFNRIEYTLKCLESIFLQNYPNIEVVLCDDGSTDNTSEIVKTRFPAVTILKGTGDLWWTGGTNMCVEESLKSAESHDFIFTVNNDTELDKDVILNLVNFSIVKDYPIVGCVNLFYENRSLIEPSAFKAKGSFPFSLYHDFVDRWADRIDKINCDFKEVDSLSGKGVLIPAFVFNKIGLYNFEMLPHYHADTEFIRRVKQLLDIKVYINYKTKVFSHQKLSGLGQINTEPKIGEFIKSFFTIKSANHAVTLWNRSKLIYQPNFRTYFIFNIFMIILGHLKRQIFKTS